MGANGLQPVVSVVSATAFEAQTARVEIDLVMDDDEMVGGDT